jgi:hypothetical protein
MPVPEPAAAAYSIIAGGRAIQCLTCLLISFNELDIEQRYCARCHRIHPLDQAVKEPIQ